MMEIQSSKDLKHYVQVALALAEEGGCVLTKSFGKLKKVENKEHLGNLVTDADKESERRILERLYRECPDHSILAEETGVYDSKTSSDFLWVIDPLDGTTNYAHQYPFFCVSVALLLHGDPIVGVVYNPIMNELFEAASGQGAKLNGQQIHVSKTSRLDQSLLVTGFAYDRRETNDNNYAEFCDFTHLTQGVRRSGSAALDLAYVAAGRCDGYWERGIQPWDVAAGFLLVREAGGVISAYDSSPFDLYSGKILATNGILHEALSHELMRIKEARQLDRP